ncbi:Bifunctional glutamate/proline--tRNA ligase [Galdieria sulphuraria]|nr:Bifunctional glutamate/proline--tRNA ligase [Galdieria sulphuraria]
MNKDFSFWQRPSFWFKVAGVSGAAAKYGTELRIITKYIPAFVAASLFTLGIALFSGSLYTLTLTGNRKWGAVTPFGGLGFILGWLALAVRK